MTKRRTILAVVLGLIMALCLSLAVACGGTEAETEVVKWTINDKEHVTVTVNDSTELPETYTVGETLTFKVVPASGYEVVVKNGRTTLKGTDNVYSIEVKSGKSANDIAITVSKAIASVAVTKNPTRMTYYAGEFLDETGMEVSVTYATGDSEKIEKGYVVTYPSGGAFTFGDTYFTVTYGGKTSEKVNLEAAVRGRIAFDLQGGTLTDAYKATLTANSEIKEQKQEGTMYYLYFDAALSAAIPLPTSEEISRTSEADEPIPFLGWSLNGNPVTAIPEKSIDGTFTARWFVELVTLTGVKYETGTGADAGKVFLVISGTYHMANSVQLYFYEGNAKVEWKGDVYTGKIGQTFAAKYNMVNLGDARTEDGADYFGKWMDIKLVASVDGVEDVQEINLNDYGDDFVDTTQMAHSENYTFSFQVYTPDGTSDRYLKAVVNRYIPPITISQEGDNVVFTGSLLGEMAQQAKTVEIDYWGSSFVVGRGTVENGQYSVSLALADMPYTTTMYFHFKVLNENGETVFTSGTDNNLLNSWLATDDTYVPGEKLGSLDGIRKTIASADNTRVLYIGYGEWGAVIGWLVNESIAERDVTLEMKGDKGYYVVSGTWNKDKLQKTDVENLLKEKYPAPIIKASDFIGTQHVSTTWSRTLDENNLIIEVNDDGTFKVSIELPPVEDLKDGLALYLQYENTDGKNIYQGSLNVHKDSSVTMGTMAFTLDVASGYSGNSQSWANGMIIIRTEDSTAKSATYEKMTLKVDNFESPTKVYYVVTVKVKNYTLDDLKKFVLGNIDASSRDLYEQDATKAKCVDEDNHLYEIWFDVTSCADQGLYFKLFFTESGTKDDLTEGDLVVELKDTSHASDGLYAVVNGKKYSIVQKSEAPYYDFPALVVTDAEATDKNPEYTDPDYVPVEDSYKVDMSTLKLELVDGKPTLTIGGDVTGYTEAEIVFDLQTNGQVHSAGGWQTLKPTTTVKIANGKFTVTVDLSGVGLDEKANNNGLTQYLMHLKFGDNNFDIEWKADPIKADENGDHVEYNNLHYTLIIRNGDTWSRDMVQLAVSEEALADLGDPGTNKSIKVMEDVDVALVEDGGKPCIVVTVQATGYTDDELKAAVKYGNVDAGDKDNPDDDFEWKSACIKVEKSGENYKLYFDLTDIKLGGDGRLWSNLFINDTKTEIHDFDHSTHGKFVVVGDKKYEIECTGDNGTWNIPCIKVGDPTTLTATSADLVVEDNKVYLSISGNATNGTAAETDKAKIQKAFSNFYVDLQMRGDNWTSNKLVNPVLTINEDGTWTAKYDITDIAVHGNPYTCHFGGAQSDLKLPTTVAQDGKSVTLNGKKYTLVNKNGATDEQNNWGVVSVLIETQT